MKYTIALLLLVGCENTVTYRARCVTPEERAEAAAFVLKCAEAANPKSDEEGEDLVAQCQTTATELLCKRRTITYNHQGHELPP